MSLYTLPADVAHKLKVVLTCEFGKAQVAMLRDGPGHITLDSLHGSLIGFPSYHGVLALIVIWYARAMPRLFWALGIINVLVLMATPIQGGHHLIDVIASFPVTALSIFLAARMAKAANLLESVNKPSKATETAAAIAG
jgi:membrane-associated phospholipid phosphatase